MQKSNVYESNETKLAAQLKSCTLSEIYKTTHSNNVSALTDRIWAIYIRFECRLSKMFIHFSRTNLNWTDIYENHPACKSIHWLYLYLYYFWKILCGCTFECMCLCIFCYNIYVNGLVKFHYDMEYSHFFVCRKLCCCCYCENAFVCAHLKSYQVKMVLIESVFIYFSIEKSTLCIQRDACISLGM